MCVGIFSILVFQKISRAVREGVGGEKVGSSFVGVEKVSKEDMNGSINFHYQTKRSTTTSYTLRKTYPTLRVRR